MAAGWDPLVLFVLACIAVIVLGPRDYVPLAGFGIMGAVILVPLTGRFDIAIPIFVLSAAGAVVLGVRTTGMLIDKWLHPPATEQRRESAETHSLPHQDGATETDQAQHNRIWLTAEDPEEDR